MLKVWYSKSMKMDKVAGSGNDEFYTPAYAIEPLLKYLRTYTHTQRPLNIWCPFDTSDSLFVQILRKEGHRVVNTHLETGHDFFVTDPPRWVDVIVSNPPYSLKNEVFQRLFSLGIPFAMLVGVVGLFESKLRFELFRDNDFEIMYMDKRVSYFKDYADQKPALNPPFSSVYLCSKLLPEKIVFEQIDKKKLRVEDL